MRFVIATLIAGVLFGSTGTAQALGTDGSNPISVGAARLVFGGGVLALVSFLMARRARRVPVGEFDVVPEVQSDRVVDHSAAIDLSRVPTWVIVAIGGFTVLTYQPFFFGGTELNGVAIGTVVALGSAPIFTGLFAWFLNRSYPGRSWALATGGAIVGITLLAFAAGGGSAAGPLGLLVSAGAGFSYATYTVLIKLLLARGWSSSQAVGTLFGTAAVGSIPVLVLSGPTWLGTVPGILMVVWLALVTTLTANLLFGYGLVGLNAATVSTLTLAEPLTASVLGLVLLHEQLSALSVAGLAVLGAAIVTLAIATAREQSRGVKLTDATRS